MSERYIENAIAKHTIRVNIYKRCRKTLVENAVNAIKNGIVTMIKRCDKAKTLCENAGRKRYKKTMWSNDVTKQNAIKARCAQTMCDKTAM